MPITSDEDALKEKSLSDTVSAGEDIDLSLLKDSLALTPWERMQANDDALNFAETLRAAMERRRAEPR